MKSGGFPCRFGGCYETWHVVDPKAMASLLAASAQRTEHEETVHAYRHQRLPEAPRRTSYRPKARPTPV
jgi:hypothetical protein